MPIEYPKKFEVCPNCGSMVRIIESEAMEEMSKGNMKMGTKVACMFSQTAIFDPANTPAIIAPKKIPMITGLYDVCADCGTLYCVEVQKSFGAANPQIRRDDFRRRP